MDPDRDRIGSIGRTEEGEATCGEVLSVGIEKNGIVYSTSGERDIRSGLEQRCPSMCEGERERERGRDSLH